MNKEPIKDRKLNAQWLQFLRTYFAVIAVGNLAWEILHLPLYTVWSSGSRGERVFAVAHCTGGDLLIALSSLMTSLLLAGNQSWPARSYVRVALLTIALGVAYTAFSEWLNVSVRRSWTYSHWMPMIPVAGGIGVSPLLQWLIVPTTAFCMVRARVSPISMGRD